MYPSLLQLQVHSATYCWSPTQDGSGLLSGGLLWLVKHGVLNMFAIYTIYCIRGWINELEKYNEWWCCLIFEELCITNNWGLIWNIYLRHKEYIVYRFYRFHSSEQGISHAWGLLFSLQLLFGHYLLRTFREIEQIGAACNASTVH